jgi:hypothetical protein
MNYVNSFPKNTLRTQICIFGIFVNIKKKLEANQKKPQVLNTYCRGFPDWTINMQIIIYFGTQPLLYTDRIWSHLYLFQTPNAIFIKLGSFIFCIRFMLNFD